VRSDRLGADLSYGVRSKSTGNGSGPSGR